jgi:hypothetical protein
MQRHSIADESYYLAVNQVLSLSQRASEIFESSEPNEKRQLLNYLLQNCRLNERNLLFELKKPFDALVKYNKCPEMLAWRDSFRTFDWVKALPVPELVIRNVRQLLALV